MTEEEWLTCREPYPLLEFLQGRGSERKLRLFAAACCRRIWPLLEDERSRRAVEVLENDADRKADERELSEAAAAAQIAAEELGDTDNRHAARAAANAVFADAPEVEADEDDDDEAPADVVSNAKDAALAAAFATGYAAHGEDEGSDDRWYATTKGEEAVQSTLARCIFGHPFRPVSLDPSWLSWSDGLVVRLAEAIYADRAFDRLPSLADALEAAGCTDDSILSHCRHPGEHVRGCWVIDLVLRKT